MSLDGGQTWRDATSLTATTWQLDNTANTLNDGTYDVELLSAKLTALGVPEVVAFGAGFTATTTGAAPGAGTATASQLNDISISSFGDAQLALKVIDSAIDSINSSRADLGALQSRFENSVGSIEIQVENLSASRGRIVDADFAEETARLSKAQVLQQAGISILAQANSRPQQVLSLLQ